MNQLQMQQMHQGQIPGLPNPSFNQPYAGADLPQNDLQQHESVSSLGLPTGPSHATSLEDLISGASKQAELASPAPAPAISGISEAPVAPATEVVDDKASKKEKDKSKMSKLVYSDNAVSPEEKMASMPRYAYTPEKKVAMV